jgi:very-short-patch-repair endonuclease
MTEAEKAFWEMVRGKKFHGLKFRRQQIIDGFIVDFYCDSLGLCVEIDGSIHDTEEQFEYDKNRDEVLALRGLKVLRLTNDELFNEPDVVVEKLKNEPGSDAKTSDK